MVNNKTYADPAAASDLLTFSMMSDICNKLDRLERKVKVLKFKNALYLLVSVSVAYYLYDSVNMRVKELREKDKTK